jgi:hypothetical protein
MVERGCSAVTRMSLKAEGDVCTTSSDIRGRICLVLIGSFILHIWVRYMCGIQGWYHTYLHFEREQGHGTIGFQVVGSWIYTLWIRI